MRRKRKYKFILDFKCHVLPMYVKMDKKCNGTKKEKEFEIKTDMVPNDCYNKCWNESTHLKEEGCCEYWYQEGIDRTCKFYPGGKMAHAPPLPSTEKRHVVLCTAFCKLKCYLSI